MYCLGCWKRNGVKWQKQGDISYSCSKAFLLWTLQKFVLNEQHLWMLGLLESSGIAIEGDYYTHNISNHQYNIIAIILFIKILLGKSNNNSLYIDSLHVHVIGVPTMRTNSHMQDSNSCLEIHFFVYICTYTLLSALVFTFYITCVHCNEYAKYKQLQAIVLHLTMSICIYLQIHVSHRLQLSTKAGTTKRRILQKQSCICTPCLWSSYSYFVTFIRSHHRLCLLQQWLFCLG